MHVAFDMDGVLLDSESDLSWLDRALDRTLAVFDLEQSPANRRLLYPPNLRDFETAAEELGVPAGDLWPVRHDQYVTAKNRAIRDGTIGPFEDVDLLRTFSSNGYLSIISNSPQAVVETFVDSAALSSRFEHVIGRGATLEAVEQMKPAPTFHDRLVAEATVVPEMYVGDTRSDALFAQRTGMDFVHLDRDAGPVRSLEAVVDRVQDRS